MLVASQNLENVKNSFRVVLVLCTTPLLAFLFSLKQSVKHSVTVSSDFASICVSGLTLSGIRLKELRVTEALSRGPRRH